MKIFSGLPPGSTGVGRLMSCLSKEAAQDPSVEVVCRTTHHRAWRELLRLRPRRALRALRGDRAWRRRLDDRDLRSAEPVVLIHPQMLGFEWCRSLIESRQRPTWLYVMDSSFFCVRSYNHVAGETASCTRCLGGRWNAIREMGCRPFPVHSVHAQTFVEQLRHWIQSGSVRCLVQSQTQADLIQKHCGGRAVVKVVGLWTADFEGLVDRDQTDRDQTDRDQTDCDQTDCDQTDCDQTDCDQTDCDQTDCDQTDCDQTDCDQTDCDQTDCDQTGGPAAKEYDVVLHAADVAAKGSEWTMQLAQRCPQLRFLLPFRNRGSHATPANVDMTPMSWETGLREHVASATIVLAPSLWSATIEGALVKSIIAARGVATIQEPTAYSSELPEQLILRLPPDVDRAATVLADAVGRGWQPPYELWKAWVAQFRAGNQGLLQRLRNACSVADRAADAA